MAKAIDNLVSVQSVLMSGVAGVAIMMITNTLWVAYLLPPRWIALALSFLMGSVAFVAFKQTLGQRILYYLCSSSIIFLVAVGSNRAGLILMGLTQPAAQWTGAPRISGNSNSQGRVLQHLDMSARTRNSGTGRLRPRVTDQIAGDGIGHLTRQSEATRSAQGSAVRHREPTLPSPSAAGQQRSAQKRSTVAPAQKPQFFTRW